MVLASVCRVIIISARNPKAKRYASGLGGVVFALALAVSGGASARAQTALQGAFSGGNSALELADARPDYETLLKNFTPKQLPPEPAADHDVNKILDLGPLRQSSFLDLSGTRPIKLEASYSEPLTLTQVIDATLANSLPIKISQESLNFQRFQFGAQIVDVLPNFSTGFSIGQAQINSLTTAYNRVFTATVRYPVFQGGQVLYSSLAQYYRQKGWVSAHTATINDTLLDVYQRYTNLVLNNAIMQIRARSLAISQAQLDLNNTIYKSGTGTQFAIMQSRTQLAADKQALLAQQVLVRQSAMALGFALDMPMAINIIPADEVLSEEDIFDKRILGESGGIAHLLNQTLVSRPELRQYELFRLAAARNVQGAAASLYPSASFFTAYTHSVASVFPAANTAALNGLANATINSSLFGTGVASNTALNQAASFSPTTGNNTGNAGANTSATTVVAGSGGNPIATTQSGSLVTSGAVAPSFASGSAAFGSGGSNINGSNTAGAGVFPGLFNNFQAGFALSWSLPNVGSGQVTNILAARTLARQAMIQANQELTQVVEQVRSSFLNAVSAREQIDSAAFRLASTREALRQANLRLTAGTGTNLELIQAQRDYVDALIAQAQAIVASNQAQVQLLHDTGLISRETILNGYREVKSNGLTAPGKKKWWPKF